MKIDTLTKEEIEGLILMVSMNRDSKIMQSKSKIDYLDSITLKNKLNHYLEASNNGNEIADIFDISSDGTMMQIKENSNIHKIKSEIYFFENRNNLISELELLLVERSEELDKESIRKDLRNLYDIDDEYVISPFDKAGFITKRNIQEFNKVCKELINNSKI